MSRSVIYAGSRAKIRAGKLLGEAAIDRLLGLPSAQDVLRVLGEYGYSGQDAEQMLAQEAAANLAFFKELAPDDGTLQCFLLEYDYLNLKILYKARLAGKEAELSIAGNVPIDRLTAALRDHEFRDLPPGMAAACIKMEEMAAVGIAPAQIDRFFDSAHYEDVKQTASTIQNKTVERYFVARADLKNLAILLRARKAGFAPERTLQMLLPGGEVPFHQLMDHYDNLEKLPDLYEAAGLRSIAGLALEDWQKTGLLTQLEKDTEDYLLGLFKEKKLSVDSIEPLLAYYIGKQREIAAIRLILAGKENGFDALSIKERMRALYG